jgi:site-specific DNA-methyltransferase (adenine-specific)
MKTLPNKFIDLAIIDSPYGIGEDGGKNHTRDKLAISKNYKKYSGNDLNSPAEEYWKELFRISKNQIVWGANHFISKIPFDSSCWIVWDKDNGDTDFADCELAWTSFKSAVRKLKYKWQGMLQENMANKEERLHPNQKPIALYSWLLKNYAKPGDKILDSHMGSQSSRIAAYKMGFDYWGCELDEDYFRDGCARFDRECLGEITASEGIKITQQKLF